MIRPFYRTTSSLCRYASIHAKWLGQMARPNAHIKCIADISAQRCNQRMHHSSPADADAIYFRYKKKAATRGHTAACQTPKRPLNKRNEGHATARQQGKGCKKSNTFH